MNRNLPSFSARTGIMALGLGTALAFGSATAQEPDWSASPSYGSHHLAAGFTPDPGN
ncbi:hypothetical protein [Halomonas sp. E19]|uniref:hypothetical protein n=1 Tax=Halomonas sp. E19 TaxID=3397247 RepID=UPI0040344046